MGNCFPSAYKWLSQKAGTRHRVPNDSPPSGRSNHLDLEFENLMLADKRHAPVDTSPRVTTPVAQSGQIMDPAIFLRSGDSNYYSWISTNEDDAADDETPTAAASEGQCEVYIADTSTRNQEAGSCAVSTVDNSWLARFKKLRHSAVASYTRRRHPYSQLSGTPNSDNSGSGGAADLEWEPEAAMLPFLSADLRWEYLNNYAATETHRKYGTNATNSNVISGDFSNLSSKQTTVQSSRQQKPKTTCSTPKSGRSSSPALEWDTDDIMDPETSDLLNEIDRIAQNLNPSDWTA